ncbi:MAG: arsenosugar biosynthesis radical SAM (seleno)protein ArsS [Thermodesulfobacteriota bacterium]
MVPFARQLESLGYAGLRALEVSTLQVNLGWRCNQACKHCHLQAGPERPEQMALPTIQEILRVAADCSIPVVDLTGGAPELNPHFEYLVASLHHLGVHVRCRSNLTVLLEPGKEHLCGFFREHRVELICSLPYYQQEMVDRVRGPGAFQKSLEALRRLNREGYGLPGSDLELHLMYNPGGAFFPPEQKPLEDLFRRELAQRHDVHFHQLYTLLNMPIGRFQDYLQKSSNYESYMGKLLASFNPATVSGLMCRSLLSVSWDGGLFDCDFHQALNLPLLPGLPQTIGEFDLQALATRPIRLEEHCYGCTAGSGSSCGGSLATEG